MYDPVEPYLTEYHHLAFLPGPSLIPIFDAIPVTPFDEYDQQMMFQNRQTRVAFCHHQDSTHPILPQSSA